MEQAVLQNCVSYLDKQERLRKRAETSVRSRHIGKRVMLSSIEGVFGTRRKLDFWLGPATSWCIGCRCM